jgi:hypothetical protein
MTMDCPTLVTLHFTIADELFPDDDPGDDPGAGDPAGSAFRPST